MACSLADMLRQTPVKSVALHAVDLDDRTFRISTVQDSTALAKSLQFAGLLHPVWLCSKGDKYQIISGFRRTAVVRSLQWQSIPALIAPEVIPELVLAQLAIWDNKSVRELNVVEEAYAVALLKRLSHNESAFRQVLQNCKLTLNPKQLTKLDKLTQLPEATRNAVAQDLIPLAVAEELSAFEVTAVLKFTDIFISGKVGLNRQREFIRLVYELAKIKDLPPTDIFNLSEFNVVWQGPESDQRRKALLLLEWLYNTRYPNIAHVREQARQKIAALAPDSRIRLNMPENFENLRHGLSFSFESRAELLELLDLCRQMADNEKLAALFKREREDGDMV